MGKTTEKILSFAYMGCGGRIAMMKTLGTVIEQRRSVFLNFYVRACGVCIDA